MQEPPRYWSVCQTSRFTKGFWWRALVFFSIALAFIIYPSDPRQWDVGNLVLYLAEPRFEVLAILGNVITGGLMFGAFVGGIYWANRGR